MKRVCLVFALASCGFIGPNVRAQRSPAANAPSTGEQKNEIVAISPSGAFEVESVAPSSSTAQDEASPDLWVVSTTDRSQRARLPKQSPESPIENEFHFSPNEEWLFGLRHVGSGLQYGNIDSLPAEAELQKRFDSLDHQLNKKYAKVLAKTEKDRVSVVRAAQRDWLKQRDAGEKLYLSFFSAAEKPRRRLQFLADVTAVRIETPPDQWE
jgi:hypothetical protein